MLSYIDTIEAAPGIAGADWTDEEVNLVKAELWGIMTNPYKFVKKHKKQKKEKCGKACWEDCDAFDKGKKTTKYLFTLYITNKAIQLHTDSFI